MLLWVRFFCYVALLIACPLMLRADLIGLPGKSENAPKSQSWHSLLHGSAGHEYNNGGWGDVAAPEMSPEQDFASIVTDLRRDSLSVMPDGLQIPVGALDEIFAGNANGSQNAIPSAVPEPGSVLLLLTALGAMVPILKRTRARSKA